jgi:hypothetical protein
MIKTYLTRVLCYRSYESGRPCKCDISTVPVNIMESVHGTTLYKSLVSPELIELPNKKTFHRVVKYFRQTVIYYCIEQSSDLNIANKRSLEDVKNHFEAHHLFVKSLYKKFTNILLNYIYR